jgi:hypothetical protein
MSGLLLRSFGAVGLAAFCLFLAVPLTAQAPGVWFSGTGYPVYDDALGGDTPYGVVVADFNRDGALDLATATYWTNNVTIFLGSGHGSLSALTASSFLPTGTSPRWIVGGDFNTDGKLDLATANSEASTVSILLGNGDGTFGTKTDFMAASNPVGIAVGDFNRDGIQDLVTANARGSSITILLGRGGGLFATPLDFATGGSPVQVVVADFNGDGNDDAAVGVSPVGVSILLGRGDGTFGAHTSFPTGSGLSSMSVGDFNGDGVLDLVTANYLGRSASLLLGGGDGTFDHRTDLATADIPLQVVAGDFNADGILDFLTASARPGCGALICAGSLTLYVGNGDGTFRGPFGVGTGPAATGIAAVDINGDGRIDLAIADGPNDGIDIFLQSAHVTPNRASLRFDLQPPGTTSAPQPVTVQSTGSFAVGISSVVLAGVDPDQFAITADECSAVRMPPGSSCNISVVFSPTTDGYKSGAVVVNHDAPGGADSVALFARPADFALAAVCQGDNPPCNSSTVATITAGQSVSFDIIGTPTPVPHYPDPVTIDCINLPSAASCTFTPRNTLDLNAGPQTIRLTIKSTAPSAQLAPRFGDYTGTPAYALWLSVPALALIGLRCGRDRKHRRSMGYLALFGVVLIWSSLLLACSDSLGSSPRPGRPGTPSGTHTVIVTATAGLLQHTLKITVVVQ